MSTPAAIEPCTDHEDIDKMQRFISQALDLYSKGNATSYNYLLQQLHETHTPVNTLRTGSTATTGSKLRILRAFPSCVHLFAKDSSVYPTLLDAIFKFSYFYSSDLNRSYSQFLQQLVSANSVFTVPALRTLIRNLLLPQAFYPTHSNGSTHTTAELSKEQQQVVNDAFTIVHDTIQRILSIAPTAVNLVFPLVAEFAPHKRLPACAHVAFVKNAFSLSIGIPDLEDKVIGLVIDQLVAIDVEIRFENSNASKEDEKEREEALFTMDDFLDDANVEFLNETSELDEMAEKLDQLMTVAFRHLECQLYLPKGSRLDEQVQRILYDSDVDVSGQVVNDERAEQLFTSLLRAFEVSILHTFRSKYPQFLLFYICSVHVQLQDRFLSSLLQTTLTGQLAAETRRSCAAYLASFVARAKFVDLTLVKKALSHLMQWLHHQIDTYEQETEHETQVSVDSNDRGIPSIIPQTATLPTSAFSESVYLSTLQTVCYLVCFRGLEMAAASEEDAAFLAHLGWTRLILVPHGASPSSWYCPLALVDATIAGEFLSLAERLELIPTDTISITERAVLKMSTSTSMSVPTKVGLGLDRAAQRNRKHGASSKATSSGGRKQLTAFFPFDPYLLRRSFGYIQLQYAYWQEADPSAVSNEELVAKAETNMVGVHAEDEDEDGSESDASEDKEAKMIESGDKLSVPMSSLSSEGESSSYSASSSWQRRGLDMEYSPPVWQFNQSQRTLEEEDDEGEGF